MNDTYVELLIKKPDSKTASLLHMIMIVAGVVFFLAGILNVYLAVIGLVILGLSIIPALSNNLEYEYLYMEKELAIDRIRKETRRKRVAVYKMEKLEIMAPQGSSRLERYGNIKTIDYSSNSKEGNPYALIMENKGEKIRIIIDTNEALLKAMQKTIPRSIYTD